ncbi:hypothetical protein GGI19_001692 [Coemansia pectinata]|uniref:Uncharacterized protein n=1 Tax=Coemansia pectinata TaxID=1052879 RepID=A0A9W8LCK6_9FUNG|nr:hypothetical protein GGI19_001692 [Coemansia pectinata]
MKLFSAATILLANVVTASVAAQTGKDAIDIIEIYRLKIMEITFQGDALTAIRAAQEAAIKSQREANESMEKVIKAMGDEVARQQSVAQK